MYHQVLAEIHDRKFKEYSISAAKFVFNRIPDLAGPVVDLGCGSGDLLKEFKMAGIKEGYGTDISAKMISLAKTKVPEYDFSVCELFSSAFPQTQVITMIGEIISYAGARVDDVYDQLEHFFRMLSTRLRSNGLLLFDFLIEDHDFNYSSVHNFSNLTMEMKSEHKGDLVKRTITMHTKKNGQNTNSREVHILKVINVEKLLTLLAGLGYQPVLLDSYVDFDLPPGRAAMLCSWSK